MANALHDDVSSPRTDGLTARTVIFGLLIAMLQGVNLYTVSNAYNGVHSRGFRDTVFNCMVLNAVPHMRQ